MPQTETAVKLDGHVPRPRRGALQLRSRPRAHALRAVPLPAAALQPAEPMLTAADIRLRTDIAVYAPGRERGGEGAHRRARQRRARRHAAGHPGRGRRRSVPGDGHHHQARLRRGAHPHRRHRRGPHGQPVGHRASSPTAATAPTATAATRPTASRSSRPSAGTSGPPPSTSRRPAPTSRAADGHHVIDVEPTADVHTVTFAFLRWKDELRLDAAPQGRARPPSTTAPTSPTAGRRTTSPRPTSRSPTPVPITPSQVMYRGYSAGAFDGWLRLTAPGPRRGRGRGARRQRRPALAHPRRAPQRSRVTRMQMGAAMESEFGDPEDAVAAASTPATPAATPRRASASTPGSTAPQAQPGDLNGAPGQPAYTPRQQLPLPPRLPHRPHPLPRDHRHRHQRRLPAAPRALEHRPPRPERAHRLAGRHRLRRGRTPPRPRVARARSASSSIPRWPTARSDGFGAALEHARALPPGRASTTPSSASRRSPRSSSGCALPTSF